MSVASAIQQLQKLEVKEIKVPGGETLYIKPFTSEQLHNIGKIGQELQKEDQVLTEIRSKFVLLAASLCEADGTPVYPDVKAGFYELEKIPFGILGALTDQCDNINKATIERVVEPEKEAVDLAKKSEADQNSDLSADAAPSA